MHIHKISVISLTNVRYSLTIKFKLHLNTLLSLCYKYNQLHRLKLQTISRQQKKNNMNYPMPFKLLSDVKHFKCGWKVHVKVLHTSKHYNSVSEETLEMILYYYYNILILLSKLYYMLTFES